MSFQIPLFMFLFAFVFPGCRSHSNLHDESLQQEFSLEYQLGIYKGRLMEKRANYQRAIATLKKQRSMLEKNYTKMPAVEIYAMKQIETTLTENMKVLDIKPLQDSFAKIKKIKTNLDKGVKVIKLIDNLEPLMTSYIEGVSTLSTIHDGFFKLFSDVGSVIPFISFYSKMVDGALQNYANMQVSFANGILYESVANKAVNGKSIAVSQDEGIISHYKAYSTYFEYWSSVESGRTILKRIVGEEPPLVSWDCYFCNRNIENLEQVEYKKFIKYINLHAVKIYIALDEVRISQGVKVFPAFMFNGDLWYNKVGGSREWRKPTVLKSLDLEIEKMIQLQDNIDGLSTVIDGIAASLVGEK